MKNSLMKRVVLLTCCFVGVTASAGSLETISFDENGNGTWVNTANLTTTFSGTIITDPSGAGTTQALVYDLSSLGISFSVTGDYKIFTPGTEDVVGVVRFYGGNQIIFYDNDFDAIPANQSLADRSGLPASYLSTLMEIDQTNPNGAITQTTVTPEAGMPGFTDGSNRQYTFLSSLPVPEPGIFSLLACGVALLGLRRKRPNINA
jgi:hypothetical protein